MKKTSGLCLVFVLALTISFSCRKSDNQDADIVYHSVNKDIILIRSVQDLQQSDDEISTHIDSIINGLIDEEFISTGRKDFELDNDLFPDIGFEIIDLNLFNPNGLPESFDSLAARTVPLTVDILDNSTYSYPDALTFDEPISESGYWTKSTCVLGTFMNAGQFQGKGERYLGIRFSENNKHRYGWVKLYCSQHNDTLRIIEYAYNNVEDSQIRAGQKD